MADLPPATRLLGVIGRCRHNTVLAEREVLWGEAPLISNGRTIQHGDPCMILRNPETGKLSIWPVAVYEQSFTVVKDRDALVREDGNRAMRAAAISLLALFGFMAVVTVGLLTFSWLKANGWMEPAFWGF